MALDAVLADQLTLDGLSQSRESARLTGAADRNLTQGLGVVNTTLIQQHGGSADDAATMAALRTAINVPKAAAAKI